MVKYVIVKVTQDTNDEHYFGWEHVKVPEEVTKGRAQITEFNNLADAVEAAGKAIEWEWHDRAIKLPEDVRPGRMYEVRRTAPYVTYFMIVKKKA